MGSYCFGIDVGGTTVKCGLFQTDGNLVDKWEIPTRTENKRRKHSSGCGKGYSRQNGRKRY